MPSTTTRPHWPQDTAQPTHPDDRRYRPSVSVRARTGGHGTGRGRADIRAEPGPNGVDAATMHTWLRGGGIHALSTQRSCPQDDWCQGRGALHDALWYHW